MRPLPLLLGLILLLGTVQAQVQLPIPPFSSTYSYVSHTRGFWFQAPVDFTITGLRVPDETMSGFQNVEVFIRATAPPASSTPTTGSVFYSAGQPSASILPCTIPVATGDFVCILGACGTTTMYNSYGSGPFTSSIDGNPVTLTRFISQNNIYTAPAPNYQSSSGSLGRVEVYYVRGPTCVINAPLSAATVSGIVSIDHDVDHVFGLPVDATFEFSTDAGATYHPCTTSGVNPVIGLPTPSTGLLFDWDSAADLVGLVTPQATDLQITVDDGSQTSTCTVDVTVDNVPLSPTCTVSLPGGSPAIANVDLDVTPDSVNAPAVDLTIEFSTDGGATFLMATPAGSGTNPVVGAAVGVLVTWTWDSRADTVGIASPAAGVLGRVVVEDHVAPVPGECVTAPFDVDNTSLCYTLCGDCNDNGVGPDVLDALTAAQLSAGLLLPTLLQEGCCDTNSSSTIEILDALGMAQFAAGIPVTLTCP